MRLAGCEINSTRPILRNEMLFYQSKENIDQKILFREITHYLDPETKKMVEMRVFGKKDSTIHFGP